MILYIPFILFFLTETELIRNTTHIVSQLVSNATDSNQTDSISTLDVVKIVNILDYVLSGPPPDPSNNHDIIHTFNLLQYVDEDLLRFADERNKSVSRWVGILY